jgi:hypothetical protein
LTIAWGSNHEQGRRARSLRRIKARRAVKSVLTQRALHILAAQAERASKRERCSPSMQRNRTTADIKHSPPPQIA